MEWALGEYLGYAHVNSQVLIPVSAMPEDQGGIIERLRLSGTLTDSEIQQISRLLENGASQDISQSGKFNLAVDKGTNIYVGDSHAGVKPEEIRLIFRELLKEINSLQPILANSPQNANDQDVTPTEDLDFADLTLNPTTIAAINVKLNLIQEIYYAGYITEALQQDFIQIKQRLLSVSELKQVLKSIEKEGDRLIESAVADMHQQLADLKLRAEDLTTEVRAELSSEELDCRQAENQILENFVSRLEDSRLGSTWIDRNMEVLKKYACKQVFKEFPDLDLPEDKINRFQLSLKQFLEQVSFCLYWGTYSILDSPKIPFELEVEHYETAFIAIKKSIKKRVSSQLRDETIHAIEACFDHLIEQLPFIDVD